MVPVSPGNNGILRIRSVVAADVIKFTGEDTGSDIARLVKFAGDYPGVAAGKVSVYTQKVRRAI